MSALRAQLRLDTLISLIAAEKLGEPHIVLQPEPLFMSDTDRETVRIRHQQELADAGLLARDGTVDIDFLDWLPLLTNASLEYYGWFTSGDYTAAALTARKGMAGLLAVRDGDRVTLRSIDRERLFEALVEQIPDVPPGGGTRWTVRDVDMRKASALGIYENDLPRDVREITKVIQRPIEGSGELYVAERDERGSYFTLPQPLHFVDTDWGRYLNHTTGNEGNEEVCIAPATPAALQRELEALRRTLVVASGTP